MQGAQLAGQLPGGAPAIPRAVARLGGARQLHGAVVGEGVEKGVGKDLGEVVVVGGCGPGVQVYHVPLPRLDLQGEAGLQGPAPG